MEVFSKIINHIKFSAKNNVKHIVDNTILKNEGIPAEINFLTDNILVTHSDDDQFMYISIQARYNNRVNIMLSINYIIKRSLLEKTSLDIDKWNMNGMYWIYIIKQNHSFYTSGTVDSELIF